VVAVIALSTAYYFLYGPFETASPAFIREQLGGGTGAYSLLWSSFGLGAIATVPLAPRLARGRPGRANAIGTLTWGMVMLPLVAVHSTLAAAGLFLLGGAVWGPYSAVETSALQRWVTPSRHGAVFGLQRSLLGTAAPLGSAAGALAVQFAPPNGVLAISAGACAAAGLCALSNHDLRRAR
jgi:hypothetical protein